MRRFLAITALWAVFAGTAAAIGIGLQHRSRCVSDGMKACSVLPWRKGEPTYCCLIKVKPIKPIRVKPVRVNVQPIRVTPAPGGVRVKPIRITTP